MDEMGDLQSLRWQDLVLPSVLHEFNAHYGIIAW